MLFLLSPAKSLDYTSEVPSSIAALASEPEFPRQSAALIALLKKKKPAALGALMSISPDLAALNVARYAAWSPEANDANSRPAVLAFDGDVYGGLDARSLGLDDLQWAQQHLVILSGLYGMLRPLDRLQPYRLEMGTRLRNPKGADLYAFWGDTVAKHLDARVAADPSPVIVNLASQEYFKVANRPRALRARVIECVFEEWKVDRYKIISFFAKRARGLMARYAVTERIGTPAGLMDFSAEGYRFDAAASTLDRLVFRRRQA
jgi:cytoplasmic iron level regulating protein YaaA (DUF328/UPF0246 family)